LIRLSKIEACQSRYVLKDITQWVFWQALCKHGQADYHGVQRGHRNGKTHGQIIAPLFDIQENVGHLMLLRSRLENCCEVRLLSA